MEATGSAWPTELRLAAGGRTLKIAFEGRGSYQLPAEYLRVMSPSAEVQGHNRQERRVIGGKRQVAIVGIEPVGTYAVRLSFDDTHATGIFTWSYLEDLGSTYCDRWAGYLRDLEARGLDRDSAGEARAS